MRIIWKSGKNSIVFFESELLSKKSPLFRSDFFKRVFLVLTLIHITRRLHTMFYEFLSGSTACWQSIVCRSEIVLHIPVGIALICVVIAIRIKSSQSSWTIKSIWTENIFYPFPWTFSYNYWTTTCSYWRRDRCSSESSIGESICIHSFCRVVAHHFLTERFYVLAGDVCFEFVYEKLFIGIIDTPEL